MTPFLEEILKSNIGQKQIPDWIFQADMSTKGSLTEVGILFGIFTVGALIANRRKIGEMYNAIVDWYGQGSGIELPRIPIKYNHNQD